MLKILKKISCLEILLVILLIYLIYNFVFKKNYEGFIEEKKSFLRHSDSDIYDDFYANIYDKILFNSDKNDFEISYIFQNSSKKGLVLDIGCGTGHHVKKISDLNIKTIGVDNSLSMIKKAQKNYPDLILQHGSILIGKSHEKLSKYLNASENERKLIEQEIKSKTICLNSINENKISIEVIEKEIFKQLESNDNISLIFKHLDDNIIKKAITFYKKNIDKC